MSSSEEAASGDSPSLSAHFSSLQAAVAAAASASSCSSAPSSSSSNICSREPSLGPSHSSFPSSIPLHLQQGLKTTSSTGSPVKVKRTRQRVDAGEPRNSYASIANFSSTRAAARAQVQAAFSQHHHLSQQQQHQHHNQLQHHLNQFPHHAFPSSNFTGGLDSKRARVENIVYNMLQVTGPNNNSNNATPSMESLHHHSSLSGHLMNGRGSAGGNNLSSLSTLLGSASQMMSSNKSSDPSILNGPAFSTRATRSTTSEYSLRRNNNEQQGNLFTPEKAKATQSSSNNVVSNECQSSNASTGSTSGSSSLDPDQTSAASPNSSLDDSSLSAETIKENQQEKQQSSSSLDNISKSLKKSVEEKNSADKTSVSGEEAKETEEEEVEDEEKKSQEKQEQQEKRKETPTTTTSSSSQDVVSSMEAKEQGQQTSLTAQVPQVNGCKKRKLYQPQQTTKVVNGSLEEDEELLDDDDDDEMADEDIDHELDLSMNEGSMDEDDLDDVASDLSVKKSSNPDKTAAENAASASERLAMFSMRKRFVDQQIRGTTGALNLSADIDDVDLTKSPVGSIDRESPPYSDRSPRVMNGGQRHIETVAPERHSSRQSVDSLAALKAELLENVVKAIEMTFDLARRNASHGHHHGIKRSHGQESPKELTLLAQMLESKGPHHQSRGSTGLLTTAKSIRDMKSAVRQSTPGFDTLITESSPAPKSVLPPGGPFKAGAPFPQPFHPGNGMNPALAQHFSSLASVLSSARPQGRDRGISPSSSPSPDDEALSLVSKPVSLRSHSHHDRSAKRNKLSDARTNPRNAPNMMSIFGREMPSSPNGSQTPSSAPPPLVPVSLPTSVAIPNPSLHHSGVESLFSGPGSFPFSDPSRFAGFLHGSQVVGHPGLPSRDASNINSTPIKQNGNSSHDVRSEERDVRDTPSRERLEREVSGLHHHPRVDSAAAHHQLTLAREAARERAAQQQAHQNGTTGPFGLPPQPNSQQAAMAQAVSNALVNHHLSMLAAANRGSPDSLHAFSNSMYTRTGSDDGDARSEDASFNDSSVYDPNMPLTR